MAELFANNPRADLFDRARRQLGQREGAIGEADEPVHREAERLQHPPHFPVPALCQRQADPEIGRRRFAAALGLVEPRLDRTVAHALDHETVLERVEPRLVDAPARPGAITPGEARGRQLQGASKAAVIGQQQQSLGGEVEAANRDQPGQAGGKGVEQGGPPRRITMGGQQPRRLVIAEQARPFGGRDRRAIHPHVVERSDPDRRAGEHRAVELDPAGGDQALDFAPGGDTRAREHLGDPLARAGFVLTAGLRIAWLARMAAHDLAMMRRALEEAQAAAARGETPVGAVLADPASGAVIATAGNGPIGAIDPTAHAEILVLRAAARAIGNYRLVGLELFVTLEPCAMCVGAISHARVGRLVFAAADFKGGAVLHGPRFFEQPTCHWRPAVESGLMASESTALLKDFFARRRRGASPRP